MNWAYPKVVPDPVKPGLFYKKALLLADSLTTAPPLKSLIRLEQESKLFSRIYRQKVNKKLIFKPNRLFKSCRILKLGVDKEVDGGVIIGRIPSPKKVGLPTKIYPCAIFVIK